MKTIKTLPANLVHAFVHNQSCLVKSASLRHAIWQAIEGAITNASDTCREEGLNTPSIATDTYVARWHEMFLSSLQGITTFRETPAAARAWFARRGIVG